MKKKTKKKIAKELLLIGIRVAELKNLRYSLNNDVYKIKSICGYSYSYSNNATSSLNMIISEIDREMKRHKNRSHKLATDLIKNTGLIFEESPNDIAPYTRKDLQNGYIELNMIEGDTLIPYILVLETGDIISRDNVVARSVLENKLQYKSNYNRKQVMAMNIITNL